MLKNISGLALATSFMLVSGQAFAFKQVVPAYFPLWSQQGVTDWQNMCDGMNTANNGSIAVVNPNSGPHTEALSYISDAIGYCQEAGHNVIGYVSTSYGTRSMTAVKADIDAYYSFYPSIDGIFLDEMPTSETATASGCDSSCAINNVRNYYSELHEYVDSIGASTNQNEVIGNMGVAPSDDWVLEHDVVDKVVIFEGNSGTFSTWTAPSWVAPYPDNDFVVMVYGLTSSTDFSNTKSRASAQGVSNIYLTDQSLLNNPWDALSIYWPQN